MKRTVLLVTLLFVAPAMAAVNLSCEVDEGVLSIYYDSNETELVRAFALDVAVTNATIDSVVACNPKFWVYPGSIDIVDPNDPNTVILNDPVAPANDPGAQGPLGTSAVTIEMGTLYEEGDTGMIPGPNGLLISLGLSISDDGNAVVTTNATRAQIVLEDATSVDASTDCSYEAGGCACYGDIYGPLGVPDGVVSTSDMSRLIMELIGCPGYVCDPIPAGFECMDIYGPLGVPDGVISTSDMSRLIMELIGCPGYVCDCIVLP